jgi:hypothetical protein
VLTDSSGNFSLPTFTRLYHCHWRQSRPRPRHGQHRNHSNVRTRRVQHGHVRETDRDQ